METESRSYVKPEINDVAIFDGVIPAFDTHSAGIACAGLPAESDKVLVADHLRPDEATFEIRMDDRGGGGRARAGANGPGATYLGICGKETLQAEQAVAGTDDTPPRTLYVPVRLGVWQPYSMRLG